MKTSRELLSILETVAESDVCVGNCDIDPPFRECSECIARRALNHVYEVLQFAYEDIELNKTRDKKGMN
jgi:hypothetical protein